MSNTIPTHLTDGVADALRAVMPERLRRAIRRKRRQVRFGSLRRVTPLSRSYGLDRGTPVDRYYIERFLARFSSDIRGRVLEIGDDTYTRRFGDNRFDQIDVLHALDGNPAATIVGDLASGAGLPSHAFDCIICTQTLPFIYDVKAAVATLHRILKPDGVLLATVPGISQICRYDMDCWGDYWRFTSLSIRRLFDDAFAPGEVAIETHGNVLAAIGFLHGLAMEDFEQHELDHHDRDYELIITIRALKTAAARNGHR